jgi:hypothetical protein
MHAGQCRCGTSQQVTSLCVLKSFVQCVECDDSIEDVIAVSCLCRCTRQYARYTCPRCRLRYCSKDCYQQHSQQCTESFSKENAVAELQSTAASDAERRQMQEILHRVHANDAGAEMAEALGMDSLDLHGIDGSRDGGGGGGGSDEDAVRLQQHPKPYHPVQQRLLPR